MTPHPREDNAGSIPNTFNFLPLDMNLLKNIAYCISQLKCLCYNSPIFLHCYKKLAKNNNIDISKTVFDDSNFMVELDMEAYAKKLSSYESTTFDMPFKELYLTIWNSAFTEVK